MRNNLLATAAWVARHAALLSITVLIIIIVLIAYSVGILVRYSISFPHALALSVGAIMGDSWESIEFFSNTPFSVGFKALLFSLRLLGWLIVPLVISALLDAVQRNIESERWQSSLQTEIKIRSLRHTLIENVRKHSPDDEFGEEYANELEKLFDEVMSDTYSNE